MVIKQLEIAIPQIVNNIRAIGCMDFLDYSELVGCLLMESTRAFKNAPINRIATIKPKSVMQKQILYNTETLAWDMSEMKKTDGTVKFTDDDIAKECEKFMLRELKSKNASYASTGKAKAILPAKLIEKEI